MFESVLKTYNIKFTKTRLHFTTRCYNKKNPLSQTTDKYKNIPDLL